jgi:D-3-phosphoglycerate dehydrogenase
VGDATAPAELTWALIMAASRRLTNYASLLQQGTWQASSVQPAHNRLGRVLNQRRLGIWGYGKIGKRIASYATAFGMHVRSGAAASRAQAQCRTAIRSPLRAKHFADSDIVTLHLRLNDATRGIVQPDDLARMKPDALFVNTSRAELLAPDALVHALDAGRPGFAAIDVFETEPVPQTTRCCTVKTSS